VKRAYIIAEAGVNHNGSLPIAKQLIDEAANAGADAVKFQTFKATHLVTKEAQKADYQQKKTNLNESQFEMLQKLELSESDHYELIDHCSKRKIDFLSTPFDLESVDLLTGKLKLSQVKLPSGEITNAPLLLKTANAGVSIILSTGMSSLGEVEQALGVLAFGYLNNIKRNTTTPSLELFHQAYASEEGQHLLQSKVTLLHCTTEYPAPFADVNLLVLDTLRNAFLLPVGLSDHSVGIAVPIAAIARGATIIEKHFTLDRTMPGPDHHASLEPSELRLMVSSIRQVEEAMGNSLKIAAPSEIKNRSIARKSIVASVDIQQGELFTEDNLTAKRAGEGISPMLLWDFLGKRALKSYKADEKVQS
jgi:N-acetylneuraminate synthase